jgi:PAS domain S-box-containing protein
VEIDNQADGQRYRHLFEHAPICIFVIDARGSAATILEGNRRSELVYGYSNAEMMGMAAIQLMPERSAILAFQSMVQQVRQGQLVTIETTHRHRDGTHFPVRVIAAPDPTDVAHMIVTVEDMAAERQRRSEVEAIDAERRRIAHEFHDGVAQSLTGLRFKLAHWSHLAETTVPGMRVALDELTQVLTDAITDLRRAIFALRPVDLALLGFLPALTQLVSDFDDHNHLVARLDASGQSAALPAKYELPLFRMIQEALNNVGQHANANAVLVRLATDKNGSVSVSIRDNGCGFDLSQISTVDRHGHFGLHQMRERIVDLGGTLDILSAPGQATELVITLPPLANEHDDVTD